jgi:hypothetical protein
MNSRLTVAVLLILIVLVGVVAYVSRQPKPSKHPHKNNDVFSPHPTSLRSFSYKPASGPTLAFKHVGTHWLIVSPIKARGRDYSIGDLAGTLADLKWRYRNKISNHGSHSLAHTGLKNPQAVLTVVDQTGKKSTLAIGSLNATGRLYVHLTGSHDPYIDVVKANWLARLNRPIRKFRNRSLTSFHTRNIAVITLQSADKTIRVVPHGKHWLLTKPFLAPAATNAVTSWISNLQLLTAHRFSGIPVARAGFKNSPLTITVDFKAPHPPVTAGAKEKLPPAKALKAPAPLVIQFGIKTDLTGKFLYAQSSYNHGVSVVRYASFKQLNATFNMWRDHHLVAADVPTKAAAIAIARATGVTANTPTELKILKKNQKWMLLASNAPRQAASSAAVTTLLADLRSVKAKSFLDGQMNLAALGLSAPVCHWTITLAGHIHPIRIAIGKSQKSGLIPVKISQWPSVYLVSPAALKPLSPKLTQLRSTTVVDLSNVKIQRVAIRRGGQTVILKHVAEKWISANTSSVESIDSLLSAWKPMKAKKWFINARSVSAVPPITVDVTVLRPIESSASAKQIKAGMKPAKIQFVPVHDVLTLWDVTMPHKSAVAAKGKANASKIAQTQWRAELVEAGHASNSPVWSFQPRSALVSAVQNLLKPQK